MSKASTHDRLSVTATAVGVVLLCLVVAGFAAGCDGASPSGSGSGSGDGGSDPTSALPGPPSIDQVAPEAFETATFGFG